jgi:hypothetical protein
VKQGIKATAPPEAGPSGEALTTVSQTVGTIPDSATRIGYLTDPNLRKRTDSDGLDTRH